MLSIVFRHGALAGGLALALVASHSTANAWTDTGSCVGGWATSNCVFNEQEFPRDPHVRSVRRVESEEEQQQSAARDRKWLAFCKPAIVVDQYGVSRNRYAHPGCEFGRSE